MADAKAATRWWARGMTLRSRLVVGLALIAVVATLAAVAVTTTTRTYLVSQLDERLLAFSGTGHGDATQDVGDYATSGTAGSGAGSVAADDGDGDDDSLSGTADPWTERPSDALRGVLLDDGTYVSVFSPNVYGDEEDDQEAPIIDVARLTGGADQYLTVPSSGDERYRILARERVGGWEITGMSLEPVEAVYERMMRIEAGSIAAVLAGLTLVGWWVIRLGVTPMRRMVDASALIAEGNLDARLDGVGSGTESAALAASLNTMIGRLTDSIAQKERSEVKLRSFVADASHELRTPLTTVLGYAQLFRKGGIDGAAQQADAWARTEAEAGRMKRLVEDMLELARYDAEPELHLAPTDLTALVAEVLADATRAHDGVEFGYDHGPVAADVRAPTVATVDADRVRQAVINVVNNAAQHGAARVTVSVNRVRAGESEAVRIDIADDGPGMSPDVAARATERFVRGDSSRSRATGGAGLGLAITAAIVEAHRGALEIASTVGHGTTVSLQLPL